MPDYQQGKIYKITYGDETYYGSTATTLRERMRLHKKDFKKWKKGVCSNCRSYTLFDKYGFENCPIELVEDYPCETKKELLIREDLYIKNKECINERSAYRTEEEVKEQKWQYHEDHKEERLERRRERVVCDCGQMVRRGDIARHRRTKLHLAKLNLTL